MTDEHNLLGEYGPYALVTGATSGIGKAFAEELAGRGFNLVLVARRINLLDEMVTQLATRYSRVVTAIEQDLSVVDGARNVLQATQTLDIGLIVSNAGFSLKGAHESNEPEEMTRMLMVNCHTPAQLTHGFIPRLKERGRGGIVLTGSVEGLIGCPYSGVYSASKAFVTPLGEALWAELKPHGVDMLTLCPGATDTEGLRKAGFDPSRIPHIDQPEIVVRTALAEIANGPTYVSNDHCRQLFEKLTSMPRDQALQAVAQSMKTEN